MDPTGSVYNDSCSFNDVLKVKITWQAEKMIHSILHTKLGAESEFRVQNLSMTCAAKSCI